MKYKDWVQSELDDLSTSLDFHYTPKEEVADRLTKLKGSMKNKGMDALLVIQGLPRMAFSSCRQMENHCLW